MIEMQIGDTYRNIWDEVHEIIMISKTGVIIECINLDTQETCKFRFYEASGKYIKNGTPNVDLGKPFQMIYT